MIYPAYIPSPPHNGFYLGPLFVHAYGLAYVFAVAGAIVVSRLRWRRAGGDPDLVYEVAAWGFPAGLIGGRIYFLITTPSQIPPHWWGPFAIWKGGLGIWGGIACGVLAGLYILRKRLTKADMLRFMDAAAPGLLVAQSIGRIGNYFNQELFGKPTTLPWGLKIDPDHRPPGYRHECLRAAGSEALPGAGGRDDGGYGSAARRSQWRRTAPRGGCRGIPRRRPRPCRAHT